MRKSKMLSKFRKGAFARVCGLGHYLPFFVRHAAHAGYDGIWLDLEHRAMDAREVQSLLSFCHYNDIDCMLRPATLEPAELYRYLEDGATGFMMPLITDTESARRAVEAVKFPPLGNRGVDGAGLDGDYTLGARDPEVDYFEEANRETLLVIEIETVEAADHMEEIAALDGVDALFIGPGDLGRRLSVADEQPKRTVPDVVQQLSEVARRHGKAWGIATGSLEDLTRYRELGAQLVPWGGDFSLVRILKQCSLDLDRILGE